MEGAKAGIICLTPSNVHSDWILFEAGALSKTLQNTFVCPFLIGLEPSDIKPPLAQFQATKAAKEDVLKLLKTLNSALGEGALPELHIEDAFEVWWPRLESQLNTLPPEKSMAKTHRPDRELLEEVLALVRNQSRPPDSGPAPRKLNRKLPLELSRGNLFFTEIAGYARKHDVEISRVTRVVPEKPENRKYLIELKSGQFINLEVPEEPDVELLAKRVGKDFASALEQLLGPKDI